MSALLCAGAWRAFFHTPAPVPSWDPCFAVPAASPACIDVGYEMVPIASKQCTPPQPSRPTPGAAASVENILIIRLAAKIRTPLLVGETARLTDLPRYLRPDGAAMLRGDTLMKGGITGLRKAMALAELHGVDLEIHTANSPLLDVANLHVACASANTRFVENHHPVFRWGLKKHPIDVGPDGYAHLPDAPGLGVELDWDWIEDHTASEQHDSP